ncbi:MAG: carotenoid biosynthesis protein [Gemmatimonadaceae bacterium]
MTRPTPAAERGSPVAARLAHPLLWMHVAIILFSTLALVTFLAGTPPAFMQTPLAAKVYPIGFKFSGPTYVVLGALAALAHAAGKFGWRRALGLLAVGVLLSLGAELTGTSTGLPFGDYSYTEMLGYRIAGLVPYPIPLSWFFMIYCCLAICGRLLPAHDSADTRMRWALVAGLVLVAWDVSMDPAMSYATAHWRWHQPGFFYGMPFLNWVGWYLTGTLVARAMLAIVPPSGFAGQVSPTTFPLILYAVNGVMPVALVARREMWWAFVPGLLAMAIPVALAIRAGIRAGRVAHQARTPHARSAPVPASVTGD